MSLTVRVGDVMVTRLAEDLTFSRSLHGAASCSFNYRAPIGRKLFNAFEKVYVFDGATADIVWDGRVEDTGRSVDGEGQAWSVNAVGELARAEDRAAPYVLVDTDLTRWERTQLGRAPSASGDASQIPESGDAEGGEDGTDCLLLQFPPGEPLDANSAIVMVYGAIRRAGMKVGGIQYTVVAGFASAAFEGRMWAVTPSGSNQIYANTYSTTPASRSATVTTSTPLTDDTDVIQLINKRTGGATTIGSDDGWVAFSAVTVKALRFNKDGTEDTGVNAYIADRDVFPHEVVADLLGRGLLPFDGATAEIDTTSTHEIDQFAYPDGATAAQILEDVMALEPTYYWQVGPENASGLPTFKYVKWPTHVRYEFSMVDGLDLPGAEAERYNRVTFRWVDRKGRTKTKTYNAGTTINGVAVPTVPELDDHGLIRQPEVQDLSDEVGSDLNADKAAAEFLLEHGTPPVAGTLTVSRKVWDHDQGRYVQPYEIEPGHLGRIRELVDDVADLGVTDRDGKSVFRVVGMTYTHDTRSAAVELDSPARTDEELLAELKNRRDRKR